VAAELFDVEKTGAVAVLTVNRPERLNAFTNDMDTQFWDALERIYDDDSVRAIVWRGEGRAFSTGRDVNELGKRDPGVTHYQYIAHGHQRTHELLIPPRLPIVVAIQGWCIGGSFERTLLCDIRVAAEDAKFRLPEMQHGLVPDSGGTARLFQMCGHGVAADLVMTGRTMDAEEALRHGVVSRVVPRDKLDEEALGIATTIAEVPPLVVRIHRQLVAEMGNALVAASVRQELFAQMLVYQSEDFAEFRAARAEERTPRYRGT
jgi:enoyl-CoA hydratase/carnithine racemase